MDSPFPRRRFLKAGAAVLGAATASHEVRAAAPPGAALHDAPADPSKALGVPMPDEGYGLRSQFETAVRRRYAKTCLLYTNPSPRDS
jgi:sulfane dehydrogenase subunit SoxC